MIADEERQPWPLENAPKAYRQYHPADDGRSCALSGGRAVPAFKLFKEAEINMVLFVITFAGRASFCVEEIDMLPEATPAFTSIIMR